MAIFKIHPGIGIARLGNSDQFYLAPEQPGALPIECDDDGRETRITDADGNHQPVRVSEFKGLESAKKTESEGEEVLEPEAQKLNPLGFIKRQAARFRVFKYADDKDTTGSEIKVGDTLPVVLETGITGPQTVEGTVTDIEWTVHLANKKASWYRFEQTEGMHGYPSSHPLRNPEVTQPDARRRLIIDPGPQSVSLEGTPHKTFAKGDNAGYPQTFPPEDIQPHPITTLGELKVNEQDGHIRLIVLGGKGNSGSTKPPIVTQYANNDGWFDDISDGPVTAKIHYRYYVEFERWKDPKTKKEKETLTECKNGTCEVDVPAWVVVGYPRYVPELLDMITMDETMHDLFVRHYAYNPKLYGVPPYDEASNSPKTEEEFKIWRSAAQFNPDYYSKFYEEIWTVLKRPDTYHNTYEFFGFAGGDPHNTGTGGNLDEKRMSMPPMRGEDPYYEYRQFIYKILRKPGDENELLANVFSKTSPNYKPRAMPLMCGHNPLSNTAPQKFYSLIDTVLFMIKQWADGKFVNECMEWDEDEPNCKDPSKNLPQSGIEIDRGVLGNLLGSSFCPGGELTWIVLNPAIYSAPYRIKHTLYQAGALSLPKLIADKDGSPAADLAKGLEPGDLTKYCGIPWQSDFHACDTQPINVTYQEWNDLYLDTTGDPAEQKTEYVPWWPAHRPIVVGSLDYGQVYWASGLPDNNAGNLEMVEAWKNLGFIKYLDETVESPPLSIKTKDGCKPEKQPPATVKGYYQVERNDDALGPPVPTGKRVLGQTKKSGGF